MTKKEQNMDEVKRLTMCIVNQILDTAETSVEKRQSINDHCDKFVMNILSPLYNKAKEWGDLYEEIAKYYETYTDDGEEIAPEEEGDLCDIGEVAATRLGLMI